MKGPKKGDEQTTVNDGISKSKSKSSAAELTIKNSLFYKDDRSLARIRIVIFFILLFHRLLDIALLGIEKFFLNFKFLTRMAELAVMLYYLSLLYLPQIPVERLPLLALLQQALCQVMVLIFIVFWGLLAPGGAFTGYDLRGYYWQFYLHLFPVFAMVLEWLTTAAPYTDGGTLLGLFFQFSYMMYMIVRRRIGYDAVYTSPITDPDSWKFYPISISTFFFMYFYGRGAQVIKLILISKSLERRSDTLDLTLAADLL